MNNKIKSLLFVLITLIFPLTSLRSVVVVDFEELPASGRMRIVALNAKTQDFLRYTEAQTLSEDLNGYTLISTSAGNINIQRDPFSLSEPMIIRSKYTIPMSEDWHSIKLASYYIYSSEKITVKTPQEIDDILPKPKKREPVGADFPIVKEGALRTLATLNKDDKRDLGELSTVLTMLSFGYIQHPSKYGGDNGFDGVFESFSKEYLWLTETKQEKKQRSAPNIMKRFLHEARILETMQTMQRIGYSPVQETASLIRTYIQEKPKCIYKMAYRMMDKGVAQCQVNPFDIQKVPSEGLKFLKISPEEKVKKVQSTLQNLEQTPQNQLFLALSAVSLISMSKEEALRIVEQVYTQVVTRELAITQNIQIPEQLSLKEEIQLVSSGFLSEPIAPYVAGQSAKGIITPISSEGEAEVLAIGGASSSSSILPSQSLSAVDFATQESVSETPKQLYNQKNLSNFLRCLKDSKYTIADKIKVTSATTIQRLRSSQPQVSENTCKKVWEALKKYYPEEFGEWLSK